MGGGNFEEVSPFYEMTLTAKVLAEHKVSLRERERETNVFLSLNLLGQHANMRASACMAGRRLLRGRGRRQAVDSCRRTRRWHLT